MSTATVTLTHEQHVALTSEGVSIALSAGAGCGKTFVLTNRFIKPFQPSGNGLLPEQIDQLIAITFTDRAAREMRERIRQRCQQELATAVAADAETIDFWRRLNRYLDTAKISTIHSYCAQLLRTHAVDFGLDPLFRVVEQVEAETLRSASIEDTLRKLISDGDEDTLALLVRFSFSDLLSTFAALIGQRERSQFDQWIDQSPQQLVEAWAKFFTYHAGRTVLRKVANHSSATGTLALAQRPLSPHATWHQRQATILQLLTRWRALRDTDHVKVDVAKDELEELAQAARIIGIREWHDDDLKQKFSKAAESLRKQIKKQQLLLERDWQAGDDLLLAAEYSLRMLRVGVRVLEAYQQRKQEDAALDFDDLLVLTHQLLTDPRFATTQKQVRRQVHLLLVDEFQDTDPLQVELVQALCGDGLASGKLFVVGDLKQSIYRFRGAQPQVFVDLQQTIPPHGRLPLSTNFRSQPAILEFVNALFHDELADEYQPLKPSRPQLADRPAIEFLWAPAEKSESGKENVAARRAREADWLARRLRDLVDSQRPLVFSQADGNPVARAATWGDCAVLFRRLTSVEEYENAFRRYQIPYYLVGGHAFYAQQEIFDVLNLLRAVAWPADAVSLAGVLRSPFFSLADETLFWLGQHARGLCGGFAATSEVPDALEQRKVEFARRTIFELRQLKDRLPVAALLERAFDLTAFDAAMMAEFMGPRKLANLNKLVDQARSFDRAGIFALADFIEQLSRSVADEPKEPFAPIHPEKSNVVRLMTIHLSKGLEFPIVAVPDLDGGTRGDTASFRFTPTLGPMVRVPGAAGEEADAGGLALYRLQQDEEDEAETRRLMYVATTRAADYLILSSGVEKLGEPTGPWTQLLSRHFDLLSGDCLGPLPPGYDTPQIVVTQTEPPLAHIPANERTWHDLTKLVDQLSEPSSQNPAQILPLVEPVPADAAARRQFSFSQLTGMLELETQGTEDERPLHYLQVPGGDEPLQFGSLVHAVLGAIDFNALGSGRQFDVRMLVTRHAARQGMFGEHALNEASELIEGFLASPCAATMQQARRSFVELEFLLAWPPGSVEENPPYLHGYIDRLWQDAAGDWHVLDFKTNRVTVENVGSTAKKYERQMFLYALAVEQIFGQAPKSAVLHFLRGGLEQSCAWDVTRRARMIDEISAAIQQLRTPVAEPAKAQ